MAIKPYTSPGSLLTFNTYQPDYIGRPVEAIGKSMLSQSNANKALLDKTSNLSIAVSNLDINPVDENIRIEQQNKFQQGIQEAANSNYNTAAANINKLYRDYASNIPLKTAISRNKKFQARKLYAQQNKQNYDNLTYDAIMNEKLTPTIPDEYGIYHDDETIVPNYMTKVDYNKILDQSINKYNITSDKLKTENILDKTGNIIGIKQVTTSSKNSNDVKESMINNILANKQAVDYAGQIASIRNKQNPNLNLTDKDIINGWADTSLNANELTTSNTAYKMYSPSELAKLNKHPIRPISNLTFTQGLAKSSPMPEIAKELSTLKNLNLNIPYTSFNQYEAAPYRGLASIPVKPKITTPHEVLNKAISKIRNNKDISINTFMNNYIEKASLSLYNNKFDKLADPEKLEVLKEIDKVFIDINQATIENSTIREYSMNDANDKKEVENQLYRFTGNKNGLVINDKGTININQAIYNNSIYSLTTNKLVKKEEIEKQIIKNGKGTIATVAGRIDYRNNYPEVTKKLDLCTGTVYSIGKELYLVGDSPANKSNFNNLASHEMFTTLNSKTYGKKGIPKIGTILKPNTDAGNHFPNSYFTIAVVENEEYLTNPNASKYRPIQNEKEMNESTILVGLNKDGTLTNDKVVKYNTNNDLKFSIYQNIQTIN